MSNLLIILTILSSFLANLETKTLQSAFNVTVYDEVASPLNYPGEFIMQAEKFRLEMLDIEAAYDGKTMYMYSGETDELTLSNPTERELLEANPFLFAKALIPVCTVTEKAQQDGQTLITLTPKDQSAGIKHFTLLVRNEDMMPLKAEIKEGKKNTVLVLKEPKFVTTIHEFVLKPSKNTFVNDMRL